MKIVISLLFVFFFSISTYAQSFVDSIQKLDEIRLSDFKLKSYAKGYKVTVLSDSVLKKNNSSLTDVLRFNSNIYFKENGYGMVSSPSFRGTNATQTAVIWNGININSQLNGGIDFNSLNTSNYNSIAIRSGGGSVQYGSGAVGGSVHLNNDLKFTKHFDNILRGTYGSFDTNSLAFNSSVGENLWTANVGVAYKESENNFKILGTDKENENGAFEILDLNINLGYVLSKTDVIKFFHQKFESDRAFSSSLVAPSKSKYLVEDYRSMLEWDRAIGSFSTKLKAVNLIEGFKYFENKNTSNFSEGHATTWMLNYNVNYKFSNTLELHVITDYSKISAKGDSFNNPERTAFSFTSILSHEPIKKLFYSLSVRQDAFSDFKSPMVFAADMSFLAAKFYNLKINASKNYRIPTFNDLYWMPGGNTDLTPETSYQFDFGHVFSFWDMTISFNNFLIRSSDLIQWQPNSALGYWSPVNIASATNYGFEAGTSIKKTYGKHSFNFISNYSYTIAKDLKKDKSLFYVPTHMANASVAYNHKAFTFFYQHLYNGGVDIIGDYLKGFDVGNTGVTYAYNLEGKTTFVLDFIIYNLYNTYYENVSLRPMPNRNFTLQLTFKF